MVELKDGQQEELDGRLQFHSQIQEAASAPQFTAGRVLQGESMLEGKVLLRITFPRQQLHGCLANGNQ